jgi:hypothetical protein
LKKNLLVILTILLILAACSTVPADNGLDQTITSDNPELQDLGPTDDASDGQVNIEDFPMETEIAEQFGSIYLEPDQVNILESSVVEWPDSCLGIEQPGIDCEPHATPGYEVVLEVRGLQFAYHANEGGSQVYPATQGFKWTRGDKDGGVCDQLIIYLPDTALACWCESGQRQHAAVNLQEILSEEEYDLLINSLTTFSENTINHPETYHSQPVMVSLAFHGQGNSFPNSNQQESLLKMAELIFSRIKPE